jgi:hypothetical protein
MACFIEQHLAWRLTINLPCLIADIFRFLAEHRSSEVLDPRLEIEYVWMRRPVADGML